MSDKTGGAAKEMIQPPTVHEVEKIVFKMDKSMRDSSYTKERQAAVIMLGAAYGTLDHDVEDIVAKTGFNRWHVMEVVRNLKASGVWKNGKTYCDWGNKKYGGVEFFCDVAVACGWLIKGNTKKRASKVKARRGEE